MGTWIYVSGADLARYDYSTQNEPDSCIDRRTVLQTEQGPMRADEIMRAVNNGHRISFRHRDQNGAWCSNPITGAIATSAPGRCITFADGRSVTLTIGHMVPIRSYLVEEVHQHEIIRVGDIEIGDSLLDGRITAIQEHGEIQAVRLWTSIPRFIKTADGLSIGTRWHEVSFGWAYEPEDYTAPYMEIAGLIQMHHLYKGAPLSPVEIDTGIASRHRDGNVRMFAPGEYRKLMAILHNVGSHLGTDIEFPPYREAYPRVMSSPPATFGDLPALRELAKRMKLRLLTTDDLKGALTLGPEVGEWRAKTA